MRPALDVADAFIADGKVTIFRAVLSVMTFLGTACLAIISR